MVFDIAQFEALLKRVQHLKIPIIATVWPLASLEEAQYATHECHLPVPAALATRIAGIDPRAITYRPYEVSPRDFDATRRMVAESL